MDEARYGGLHCADLAGEMARLNRDLAVLSTEQHAKRVNDAVAWARLFYPAHSARTRDIRPSIALDKGELRRDRTDHGTALHRPPLLSVGGAADPCAIRLATAEAVIARRCGTKGAGVGRQHRPFIADGKVATQPSKMIPIEAVAE